MSLAEPTVADLPSVMRTRGWADYALLDSGHGRKLERYGRFRVVRPEPQCLWAPALPAETWEAADAVFDPTDEEDAGRWKLKGQAAALDSGEAWPLGWREVRRGSKYEGIILDPPKYGRGPDGEVWRLFEDLPELAGLCAELLSENAKFLVLNAYAERISGAALSGLLADKLMGRGGRIEWGELALVQEGGTRQVGMSFYARWAP